MPEFSVDILTSAGGIRLSDRSPYTLNFKAGLVQGGEIFRCKE